MDNIDYKYQEPKILEFLAEYIDSTYTSEDNNHYAQGSIETSEYLIDQGMGLHFFLGNVIKYASRYGKKAGNNPKDLMKVLHYGIMAYHCYLLEEEDGKTNQKEIPRESERSERGKSYFIARKHVPYNQEGGV